MTRRRFTLFSGLLFFIAFGLVPSSGSCQTGWHSQTLPGLATGVTYDLQDIQALNTAEVWLAGGLSSGEAALLKTADGMNWSLVFSKGADGSNKWQSFYAFGRLSVVDGRNAWAAGNNGLMAYTEDGGLTWFRDANTCNPDAVAGTGMHNYGLKAVTADVVWAVGPGGSIWHRPFSGDCASWGYYPYRQESSGTNQTFFAVDAADGQNAWAVGYSGIVHTTDGGATWQAEAAAAANDVAAANANVAWAVGNAGLIMKTVDGGAHWVVQGSGVTADLYGISAVSPAVAWAGGAGGTIVKTEDGGTTWRSQVSGTTTSVTGIAAADADRAWAIVNNRTAVIAVADGGVYQPLSSPCIRYVSPTGAPMAGGSSIDVAGEDFRKGARVYFGTVEAAAVTYNNASRLTATAPAHEAAIVDVTVVNPDGQAATLAGGFAFIDAQPLIVSLSPSYGYVNSSETVTITGGGLTPSESASSPAPTVNVNGTAIGAASSTAYRYAQVTIPASVLATPGMIDVTVTTSGGTSNALPFAVNYGTVSVSSSNSSVDVPSLSGPIGVTFFDLANSGTVKAAKVLGTPQRINQSCTTLPAGHSFFQDYHYNITVGSGLTGTTGNICFPYTDAEITAAGLEEAKLRLLRYASSTWTDVTYTLDTSGNRICGTAIGLGTYFALAQGTAPASGVTKVTPAIGVPAGGQTVTITGTLFAPDAAVAFGGVAATNVTVVNGVKITAATPAHALGVVDVVVTHSDGRSGTLAGGFEYTAAPTVTAVSPASGHRGTAVTITGTGFRSGCTVTFGGTAMSGPSITATTITGSAPTHDAGVVDVVVTNADGQSGTLTGAFTYIPAPVIKYIEPNAGPVEGGTTVTIAGAFFQSGTTVTFGSTAATDVVVVDSTTLTAVTPAHAAGKVDIQVANPDGQGGAFGGTTFSKFTYGTQSPSIITWESPASIRYGTPLGTSRLNAAANVAGTFTYRKNSILGTVLYVSTVLSPGTYDLYAGFTPTDTTNYTYAQKAVTLVVRPAAGDVDGDNAVTLTDAVTVLRLLSGLTPATVNAGADADGDGAAGMADAIFVLQKVAGVRD